MQLFILVLVGYIAWSIYHSKKKREQADPVYLTSEYEAQAYRLISFIKADEKEEHKSLKPLPDVLMMIDRLQHWYDRLSEIDKHNKAEALKHAEDWKDAAGYIHDIHFYYLKCNADVDESDMEEVGRSGAKLQEIEKRWALRLGDDKLEEYWKNEKQAKSEALWGDLKK